MRRRLLLALVGVTAFALVLVSVLKGSLVFIADLMRAIDRNVRIDVMTALVAQESTFQADVKSSAGAWGLMQIEPGTGRMYANRLQIRPYSVARLKQPEVNVRMRVPCSTH